MRSVLNEEMDIIWYNYGKTIEQLGFKKMMFSSCEELQKLFTLNYKDLFNQVKSMNQKVGKSRQEVSYSILKLRRLMALWQKNKVWVVDGGISYSNGDVYNEFPNFASQNPKVIPSVVTIKKLQAKAIHKYIKDYNANYARNVFFGRSHIKVIRNLRDLRNVLVAHERLSDATANSIVRLYSEIVAKKEVSDFSNEIPDSTK
ncbi:MAG: hypothetical protein E7376_01130 [Clostridiales bacterium]|nr:hypothetical protein [Clostridiales bacterium]